MSKSFQISKGIAMDTQKQEKQDVATLIELLKMAAERWPRSDADEFSQSELLREDHSLLEMWPKPADAPESEGVNFRLESSNSGDKDWAGRTERFAITIEALDRHNAPCRCRASVRAVHSWQSPRANPATEYQRHNAQSISAFDIGQRVRIWRTTAAQYRPGILKAVANHSWHLETTILLRNSGARCISCLISQRRPSTNPNASAASNSKNINMVAYSLRT
jgi:hypothetical protein